jgi:hypothetical protein
MLANNDTEESSPVVKQDNANEISKTSPDLEIQGIQGIGPTTISLFPAPAPAISISVTYIILKRSHELVTYIILKRFHDIQTVSSGFPSWYSLIDLLNC